MENEHVTIGKNCEIFVVDYTVARVILVMKYI